MTHERESAAATVTVNPDQEVVVALAPADVEGPLLPNEQFPGVDIDAIHYKRGAVRRSALNRKED